MARQVEDLDRAFVKAVSISHELLRRPDVADQWSQASALPKMSVGALACHLGRQTVRAAELLPAATDVAPLDSAVTHYERAAWVTAASPDDPPNDRSADDAEAALGVDALSVRAAQALQVVSSLFASGTARDVVLIPWQGWSLWRNDFLLTRLLEIVVHTDDLAVSIDVPTPEFPPDAFGPVQDLLVQLAVARRGQSAFIGTLTRRERAQAISAF